jgi:hypothetical protein
MKFYHHHDSWLDPPSIKDVVILRSSSILLRKRRAWTRWETLTEWRPRFKRTLEVYLSQKLILLSFGSRFPDGDLFPPGMTIVDLMSTDILAPADEPCQSGFIKS